MLCEVMCRVAPQLRLKERIHAVQLVVFSVRFFLPLLQ